MGGRSLGKGGGIQAQPQQPQNQTQNSYLANLYAGGGLPWQTQWGPTYSSQAARYSSTTPALSTPAGFIPPPGGYGVPTNILQQVNTPYPPSSLSGSPTASSTPSQQAGFSPLNTQPNYNMMMGGTTGYKSTMK